MSATRAADAADDFRGPLDIARAATVVLDGRDTVVGWSPAATELLGFGAHEAVGRPLSAFLSPLPAEGPLPAASDRPAGADR
ncbi:PAS domain-containing protein, partial [Streptomyces sp. SID2119]|uniref:PAS domain-containing protein n=2 Tax=Streptomyces TaxID=1883 RepID=UPI001368F3E8|nr:PAS domain-containing protein [Streptomyces sp. SID2119]